MGAGLIGPLYLTRMKLNFRRGYQWDDCYVMHVLVGDMFADDLTFGKGEPRVLWRLTAPWLLVQSPVVPDHTRLADGCLEVREHALGFPEPILESKRIDRGLNCVRLGQVLRFKVIAAPPTRVLRGPRDARVAWLMRKGDACGYQIVLVNGIPDVRVTDLGWLSGTKVDGETTHNIQRPAVQFEGRLRVTHPASLVRTVACGFGDGRSFGLGLFSLAPAV